MTTLLTVSLVNAHLNNLISNDPFLNYVEVRGEIINLKRYPNAVYFTLKEGDIARLSAVSFNVKAFPSTLKDGDEVVASGKITLYSKSGSYQITCFNVAYYGEGAKLLALAALKRKLEAEGLFAKEKKKALPTHPLTIGLITPKDSAAYSDVVTNLKRRYPGVTLKVMWATFQGESAPESLIKAFTAMNELSPDVIIMARGGGSSDDLWAFNDEMLVRTLAKRKVPLISAIGHEIDTTLVDYVADVRASTPTMAAELCVPDQNELLMDIVNLETRLFNAINTKTLSLNERFVALKSRPILTKVDSITLSIIKNLENLDMKLKTIFAGILNIHEINLIKTQERLNKSVISQFNTQKETLTHLNASLMSLNPSNVLSRGYAFISKEAVLLKSAKDLNPADNIEITFSDGTVKAIVKGK